MSDIPRTNYLFSCENYIATLQLTTFEQLQKVIGEYIDVVVDGPRLIILNELSDRFPTLKAHECLIDYDWRNDYVVAKGALAHYNRPINIFMKEEGYYNFHGDIILLDKIIWDRLLHTVR